MRQLILVKHAMPEVRAGVPAAQWHLSAAGREDAVLLANRLAPYAPFRVFASREPKAIQTAEAIAARRGIGFEVRDDLHEHDRRGAPFLQEKGAFEAQVVSLIERPGELVFGNETADEAHRRFAAAVDEALRRHRQGNLAVVSHGTVMALFVARAAGADPVSLWRALGLPAIVVMAAPGFDLLEVIERAA